MARYDAIVVGAGYAGLAAAAQLGGRRVLLLEARGSVVQKARGSLGLALPLGAALELSGDELVLPEHGLRVPGGVRAQVRRLELRGLRERAFLPLARPWLVLDERRLKGAWLRRVREAGVEVRLGVAAREVQVDGRLARVLADQEHLARLVVAADGAHGPLAEQVNPGREKLGVLFQREVELDRLDLGRETLLVQLLGPGRVFVALALGDRYQAGLLQIVGPHGVPADLDGELSDRVERLGGGRRLAARAAMLKLYRPARHAYRANLLAAGDGLAAYGLATIGGALAMGALAGRCGNRFLAGSSFALPDYQRAFRAASGQPALERLRRLRPLWRLGPAGLDRWLRLGRLEGSQSLGPRWARLPLQLARWLLL
jgi:flavin-dependent dehydrogenase